MEILQYLLTAGGHPTREAIYEALCEPEGRCSLASVYNSVNLFVRQGLLRPLPGLDSNMHFDIELHLHGHFQCTSCSRIWNFPIGERIEADGLDGFTVQRTNISLLGLCPDCQKNNQADDPTGAD